MGNHSIMRGTGTLEKRVIHTSPAPENHEKNADDETPEHPMGHEGNNDLKYLRESHIERMRRAHRTTKPPRTNVGKIVASIFARNHRSATMMEYSSVMKIE